MSKQKKIIVVDDNLTNLNICKNILRPYYEVYPAPSAAKLFDLLNRFLPDLILMDVAMPDLDGKETTRILKNNADYKEIPIIFLTSMRDEKSELEGLDLGALDYIYKPIVAPLLLRRLETHLSLNDYKIELQELNASIQKKLMEKMQQVMELQNAVLQIVGDLVESRDSSTGSHVLRTQKYLRCLLDKLVADDIYSDEIMCWDMDYVLPSAQLHDLGKIGISDSILNKPGKLTPEEFDIIKTHVQIGVNAIERMEKTAKESSFLKYAKAFALTHHEKWNGTGYPCGLKGVAIPLEGRLMAIVDVYDALVSDRPYKRAYPPQEAATIIEEGRGTHFDPILVDVFTTVAKQFESIAAEEISA